MITKSSALIGGGIYYNTNTVSALFECTDCFDITTNSGYFYGNGLGSTPRYIAQINSDSSVTNHITIQNALSGRHLSENIYVNLFDEENNPLNF